jgi:Bacteriophage baseplate protein W
MAALSGWRFDVPLFDQPDLPVGLMVGPSGGIDTVSDNEAIRQSLLLLISTRPGERVMRPLYGCDLDRLVFSPNDDTTAGLAMHLVQQAVGRWEPRVEVLRVDASRAPVPPLTDGDSPDRPSPDLHDHSSQLVIVLDYRVRATGRTGQVVIPLDLASGGQP